MGITRLTATYRITTPMFSAGADQQTAELRAASFKGALRFWFRAVAWGEHASLGAVKAAEDVLFGSTRTGQARVLLSLTTIEEEHLRVGTRFGLGLGYLAGQGISSPNREGGALTTRPSIRPGTRLLVRLLLRSMSTQEDAQVRRSLIALGLIGGMGARSRRGFGSLTLESLVGEGKTEQLWTAPSNLAALKEQLVGLFPARGTERALPLSQEPPYTALSGASRLFVVPPGPGEEARDLLDRLGMALVHFRGYGRKTPAGYFVGDVGALQWFSDDHDNMWDVALGHVHNGVRAPRRTVFGLPHNYYFKDAGPKGTKVDVNAERWKRRASPLLLHVHEPPDERPVAIVSFLPALFLPGRGPRLLISRGRSTIPAALPADLWSPIHQFLDEIARGNESRLCEKFPGAVEVER